MRTFAVSVFALLTVLHAGNCVPVRHKQHGNELPKSKEFLQSNPIDSKPDNEVEVEPTSFPHTIQDDQIEKSNDAPPVDQSPPTLDDLITSSGNHELSSAELDNASADLIFKTILALFQDDPALLEGIIQEMKSEEKELQKVYDQVTRGDAGPHIAESPEEEEEEEAEEEGEEAEEPPHEKRGRPTQVEDDVEDETKEIDAERQRLLQQFHKMYVPVDEDSRGNPIYTEVEYDPEPLPKGAPVAPEGEPKPDYIEEMVQEYNDHKLDDDDDDEIKEDSKDDEEDDDEEEEDEEESEMKSEEESVPNDSQPDETPRYRQSGVLYDSTKDARGSVNVESRSQHKERLVQAHKDRMADQLSHLHQE